MKKKIEQILQQPEILHILRGKRVQLTARPGYRAWLYIVKGKVCIGQESIAPSQLVVFEKPNEEIILTAEEDAQILFFSAEPETISDPLS